MKHKMHKRSLRLYVNAGMRFPLCYYGDGPLDTDKSRLPTTGDETMVTCKRCLRIMKNNEWS